MTATNTFPAGSYAPEDTTQPPSVVERLSSEASTGMWVAVRAKIVANWLLGEFTRLLHATGTEVEDSRLTPEHFSEFFDLIYDGTLSIPLAKRVFEEMFYSGKQPSQIIVEQGLTQISEAFEIESAVDQVLAANAQAVADFKKGKEGALRFLVGQVMRATKGRANPKLVNDLVRNKLQ